MQRALLRYQLLDADAVVLQHLADDACQLSVIASRIDKVSKANSASIQCDSHGCILRFDYLDRRDSIVLLFLHPAEDSGESCKVSGKIKGCRLAFPVNRLPYEFKIITLALGIAALLLLPFAAIRWLEKTSYANPYGIIVLTLLFLITVSVAAAALLMAWPEIKRHRTLHQKK